MGKVKGRHHVFDYFPGSSSLASILVKQCVHHQEGPRVRMISQRQPPKETHLYKPWVWEPWGKVLLVSHIQLLSTCVMFPEKSLTLSACMSPPAIHFQVLNKSLLPDPERNSPSCNSSSSVYWGFELCKKAQRYCFVYLIRQNLYNKSTSCLSFCLSLTFFCVERQRHKVSVGQTPGEWF